MLQDVLDYEAQGDLLEDLMEQEISTTIVHNNKSVDIALGKSLNINANLEEKQQQKLIQTLSKYQQDFSWEYSDMKGIYPQLCTHHIYIEKDSRPIRQSQRRLNPHIRDIVKEEIQKLLDADFIYPISDS
jgi:Rps23 Pro-64 3,4-dihydroxylase Tpa1-like proline 4-hydroxylase